MSLNHPQKHELIAFGQGKLEAEQSSLVEQHLEVCRECCETLLDLKDDTFVGLVKVAQASDAKPNDKTDRDDVEHKHASEHDATVLVQSGEPIAADELPPELAGHPRYRVVELIGRGGMGNVYRAEHRLMNRAVAIKLINSQLVQHPQAVERFRREVQAAAKLSHPNIVAAYDAEQAGNAHFLVMEFVEGTDLASVVKQLGPMSVAEACECVRQAAAGLQHAHEKGMVHRDIKPHNLMLAAGGQVRILDFGLAGFASESLGSQVVRQDVGERANEDASETFPSSGDGGYEETAAHLTKIGSVMGTPDYMAPEQAADAHSAGIRADIYSLGCTLHFLLTGKPPFAVDNIVAKLKAHANEPPPSLTTLRKDVPADLSNVVARMLAKNPSDRFQNPAAVVSALEPFTREVANQHPWIRRWAAAAVFSVLSLLAGVLVMVTDRGRLEIQSEVDDVKVVVKKGSEQVKVFDLKTGSQMKWIPGGEYELEVVGDSNDVRLDKSGFTMSRLGHVIVAAKWNVEGTGVIKSFSSNDKLITQDGVEAADGGWKITAAGTRTVRLFEVPMPPMKPGPYFYRAKLKCENVTGRAYLEMWSRFPSQGEFFSKGFDKAITGTNGWAEYEVPFYLKKGEQPDLAKLNVTIEGGGTIWIKDIELRGRVIGDTSKPATEKSETGPLSARRDRAGISIPTGAMSETVTTGYNGGFEITKSGLPVSWSFYTPRTVPNADFDIVMDKADFKEGEQSLKFVVRKCEPKGGRLSPGFFNEFHIENHNPPGPFETKPGETYKISFWAKNAGSEFVFKARGVSALDGDKGVVVTSKDTFNEWRRFECIYTIPPKMWLRLELNVVQPGAFWIDDLQIARVNEKPNATPDSITDIAKSDHERLQGRWNLVSFQVLHRKFDQKELAGQATIELTFAGNTFNMRRIALSGEKVPAGTIMRPAATDGQFFLDTSKNPKRITVMVPKDNLNSLLGIYRLDGDKLTLCCIENPDTTEYPTEFATKSDNRVVLYEFRRAAATTSALSESLGQAMAAARDSLTVAAYLNDPRNNRGGSVPVALLGQNGRVAFRFGTWRVVFEGIVCDPKVGLLGFSNFNVPQPGSSGEGTIDFGAGDKLPGVLIKFKFANDTNEISINNHRFKLKGKATRLEFDDKAFDATNSLQTILVARDGSTRAESVAPPPAAAAALFDRWVGEWDATFEVKPNAQSPDDRHSRGTMTTRKVLGDRFLLTNSANDSDSTQWLSFLTYDPNFSAYRILIFGSGGEAFERRGQWDAGSQMLTLQLVPPFPGVTGQSTDRFIGDDRIESTLFVKSATGQVTRDNRWSAKKRISQPEKLPDIPTVAVPASSLDDQSQLNKFVGEWTIRATYKPSIWNPNSRDEALTEKVAWILGGRFLMARTFNERDELTSMWLATYEPAENSNRFWFFNADGSSGQWRVTWDASSRGFHWRSIDMPTGWIGTGFNRWINDDTFDNQALIKDESGRVLLEGLQDKRRKRR